MCGAKMRIPLRSNEMCSEQGPALLIIVPAVCRTDPHGGIHVSLSILSADISV